ncbi:hypothetical protein R6Q59_015318 [Mikania micrantha]
MTNKTYHDKLEQIQLVKRFWSLFVCHFLFQKYKNTLSLPKVKTLTEQFPSPTAAAVSVTTAAESLHHSVLIILRRSPPHQSTRSDLAPPPTTEPIVTDLAPPPTAATTGSASSRRPPPSASSVLIIDHDFVLDPGRTSDLTVGPPAAG